MQSEDVYEERIARFLKLAEAAQSAADRTPNEVLKITYARLAGQWVELPQMAARTISLAREAARALPTDAEKSGSRDRRMH